MKTLIEQQALISDLALKSYPDDILPYQTGTLRLDHLHTLAYKQYGNTNGIPLLVLHGGPGSGSSRNYLKFIDPAKYNIILFDQRGSGASTPNGELTDNTTAHLIKDIETLRQHLKIERWAITGGSWGTTLALLYAESFPSRVTVMILRGIFLARHIDIRDYVDEHGLAARTNPLQYALFKSRTKQYLECAGLNSTNDLINDNYRLLFSEAIYENTPISQLAAVSHAEWEIQNLYMAVPPNAHELANDPSGVNMGRIEMAYMYHNCFIRENQIIEQVASIQHIPTYIVSGKYDLVCPVQQAHTLYNALSHVTFYKTIAPHSGSDPQNLHYLALATDEFAQRQP